MRFDASEHSYGADAEPATKSSSSSSFMDKVTGLIQQPSTQLTAWNAVVNALSDPRERVATLQAKIKNYKAMKAKYGVGPVGDLYQNQIVLMQARLKAERENLALEKQGEASTATWRDQGHMLGYVGIGLGLLTGAFVVAKTVQAARS